MSQISCLREKISTKTLNLVLLTIATSGIYPILWLYRYYPVINEVTETKSIDDVLVVWIAVCIGMGGSLLDFGENVPIILGGILVTAGNILYLVCAFKMRASLQEYALQKHKVNLPMNRFYTFIFTIYYVNYCINDLECKSK